MHADDWETLSARLAKHMANVRRVFNELIGDDETQSPDEQLAEYWRELWQDALQEDDTSPALAHLADAIAAACWR
jgi:glutamate-ammonia-ligase adenylyltransferase